jgi:hypothetical protein
MSERKYIAPLLRIDGEGVQIHKLSHHHLAVMDYMLANPQVPLWAVAKHFHRTQAWLSTVINSDLFQAHMHERRKLMEDSQREAIRDRLFRATESGMDSMIAALADEEVSVAEKRAITRMSLEAQGFFTSGKAQNATVVVNNNNVAQALQTSDENKSRIQQARERILSQSRNAQLLLSSDGSNE